LREKGWTTLACLDPDTDPQAEAARLGCTHILAGGKAQALKKPAAKPAQKPAKKGK